MKDIQEDFESLLTKVRVFENHLHDIAKGEKFTKRPDYYSIIQAANSLALAKTYFDMYVAYKDLSYE